MKEVNLHLPEIKFSDAPTQTQLSNMCRDISKFLNNVGASLIIDGTYMANEPQCGELLNTATKLKALADFVDNPNRPNSSGLAVPHPAGPIPVPMR